MGSRNVKSANWLRRVIQWVLVTLVLVMGVDYGKHVFLKRALENEISQSQGIVTLDSLTISLWPLLQNHLVVKNFHVNVSGTPLFAKQVCIRQGWKDWSLAHVQASDVQSEERVKVQEVKGILDTKDLGKIVKVSALELKGIQAKLPLFSFSGSQASFDFLYEMATHQLSLKMDAPDMSFPNGASFGLNGQGQIHTQVPITGKMDVKIKNIDKMLKELVAVGVIDASQAELVTAGSNFLGKIGLSDLTLPLKIQDGDVTLGPINLFKVG
jgi:hypothetical protein